jgi:phage tail tape-measure protein
MDCAFPVGEKPIEPIGGNGCGGTEMSLADGWLRQKTGRRRSAAGKHARRPGSIRERTSSRSTK